MRKKAVAGVMVTLLLWVMLALTSGGSCRPVLAAEQGSIGPGSLPDWHEDAQVQLGWIFDDPTNPQNILPLPGWNLSIGDVPVWDYDPDRIVWDQPGQWYIRILNLNNDRPVKNFWISWVYNFDTYLPGLRSATNIEWFPDDGSGNFTYVEEWFDGDGNLTENFLEAVYARATLGVNLYPNPQYEDVWLGTYGEVALAREVYILTLCPGRTPTEVFFNMNPNPVGVGEPLAVKGILVDAYSIPLGNESVKLYVRPLMGPWRCIASVTTNSYGIFAWQATVPGTAAAGTYLFAGYYPGSETHESTYNLALLAIQ